MTVMTFVVVELSVARSVFVVYSLGGVHRAAGAYKWKRAYDERRRRGSRETEETHEKGSRRLS